MLFFHFQGPCPRETRWQNWNTRLDIFNISCSFQTVFYDTNTFSAVAKGNIGNTATDPYELFKKLKKMNLSMDEWAKGLTKRNLDGVINR